MFRSFLRNAGFQPKRWKASAIGLRRYLRHRAEFLSRSAGHGMPWGTELPMFNEWDECAGSLGAYFHQDQTVARWIYESSPQRHVDVGSRIDGFIGSLSVFRHVDVIDIRPLAEPVRNVAFHQLDLMEDLPAEWIECTDSLSCLHTIEHFGLGRYGDPIDPDGHIKGLEQLKRMVKPGGLFYFSTPAGRERIEFNAHRIFSARTILSWFQNGWTVERCTILQGDSRLVDTDENRMLSIPDDLFLPMLALRKTS